MSLRSRKIIRREQSLRTVAADYKNPLCSDLRFLVNGENPTFDLISKKFGTIVGTASRSVSDNKAVSICSDKSSAIAWTSLTPVADVSKGLTILLFAKATAEGSISRALTLGDEAAGSYTSTQIVFNANAGTAQESGSIDVISYSGGVIASSAAASVIDNLWNIWAFTRIEGESFKVYKNGVLQSVSLDGTNGSFTFTPGIRLHGAPVSTTTGSTSPIALSAIWGRALNSAEIAQLAKNPWQLFAPRTRQVFIAGAAGSNHATSGALSTGGANLAGTAAHKALHTTSGALANAGAAIAGAATNFISHATSGVLANSGATIAGAALNFTPHATTGVLANAGAAIAGVADHIVPGSTHSTSGALAGSGAAIIGSSAHIAKHATSGSLAGAGASLSGSASNVTVHSVSGNLSGGGAVVNGSSSKVTIHAISGALAGASAVVTGSASRYSPGTSILTQGDIDAIANAVWSHSSAVLIEQQLLEAWGRLGLDPDAPLITGQTSVTFGSIVMAMVEASGSITVTRQ